MQSIGQKPFDHISTNPKDAVISPITTINQVALTRFDHL
jgi:hypothetical protein